MAIGTEHSCNQTPGGDLFGRPALRSWKPSIGHLENRVSSNRGWPQCGENQRLIKFWKNSFVIWESSAPQTADSIPRPLIVIF